MGRKCRKRMKSSRMASSRWGSFFQEGNRGSIDNVKMKIRLSNIYGDIQEKKAQDSLSFLDLGFGRSLCFHLFAGAEITSESNS